MLFRSTSFVMGKVQAAFFEFSGYLKTGNGTARSVFCKVGTELYCMKARVLLRQARIRRSYSFDRRFPTPVFGQVDCSKPFALWLAQKGESSAAKCRYTHEECHNCSSVRLVFLCRTGNNAALPDTSANCPLSNFRPIRC